MLGNLFSKLAGKYHRFVTDASGTIVTFTRILRCANHKNESCRGDGLFHEVGFIYPRIQIPLIKNDLHAVLALKPRREFQDPVLVILTIPRVGDERSGCALGLRPCGGGSVCMGKDAG